MTWLLVSMVVLVVLLAACWVAFQDRSVALYQIGDDRGHSGRAKPVPFPGGFSLDPIPEIGRCGGHRIQGEATLGEPPDAERWLIDVRAVSDGKTVYLFIARGTEQNLPGIVQTLEAALGTLELSNASR